MQSALHSHTIKDCTQRRAVGYAKHIDLLGYIQHHCLPTCTRVRLRLAGRRLIRAPTNTPWSSASKTAEIPRGYRGHVGRLVACPVKGG
jgi:hypothetical protein